MAGQITEYGNGELRNPITKFNHSNRARLFRRPDSSQNSVHPCNPGNSGRPGTGPEGRKRRLAAGTKHLLDFMFYGAILVTLSLPFSIYLIGQYIAKLAEDYWALLAVYFILGMAAAALLNELRKIFRTVLAENCFVQENVKSLRRMGNVSFFIVVMSIVRSAIYLTLAMGVVIFVFLIAGLFSKVLAYVFEEAVRYKEENDMTI